jgi:hypothetical protein
MIKEHDRIVLTEPLPAEGLEVGDVGTVVHVYADAKAFEVEFTTLDGKTSAVATVEAVAARPRNRPRDHPFSTADARQMIPSRPTYRSPRFLR